MRVGRFGAIVAALVATNLAGQGCQVTQAEDGQAAWELIDASATEFDAILLDRDMPRMDGLTLLGKLRARPDTAQVPVIMATPFFRQRPESSNRHVH